jgi:hypothetical protein
VVDTSKSEEAQANGWEAHRVAAAKVKTDADTTLVMGKKKLYKDHAAALSIRQMNERERWRTQRGRILAAIQEVQERPTNRRREAQAPAEELLNGTVVKNWMPWLFDAMVAPDADPDVKRMALEAGDRANINQIYSAGASQQQWGAFVTEYRIRQILWTRDNPTKITGGTHSGSRLPPRRRPATRSGAASTCAGDGVPTRRSTWSPAAQGAPTAATTRTSRTRRRRPEPRRSLTIPLPTTEARGKATAKAKAKARGKAKAKAKAKARGEAKEKGSGLSDPDGQPRTAGRALLMGSAREAMLEPRGGQMPRHTLRSRQHLDRSANHPVTSLGGHASPDTAGGG